MNSEKDLLTPETPEREEEVREVTASESEISQETPEVRPHRGKKFESLDADELWELWPSINDEERVQYFKLLEVDEAEDFYSSLPPDDQAVLIEYMEPKSRRLWMRTLPPDDAADVLQHIDDAELRLKLLACLPEKTRRETEALLAYAEDAAGGLMSPRFARIRPEMTVGEAIAYIRKQVTDEVETLYYSYVLDSRQRLLGVVSFSDLFRAKPSMLIRDMMETDLFTVSEDMDQESVAVLFARADLFALPVLNEEQVMVGIITIDDIVDVVQEEATEDIQKLGGMSALDTTYFQTTIWEMFKKRAGWLVVLFFGSLITTKAMAGYEDAMSKAVILTVFVPLIISTGGNSGSQAATLITRAMALEEVRLRDVLHVFRRELVVGLVLGLALGLIGFARVFLGQAVGAGYGDHYLLLAQTIGISITACVLYGSLVGSMLPFLLKFLRVDPASASAPFVSTLVDATGIVIYFSIASLLLTGSIL